MAITAKCAEPNHADSAPSAWLVSRSQTIHLFLVIMMESLAIDRCYIRSIYGIVDTIIDTTNTQCVFRVCSNDTIYIRSM